MASNKSFLRMAKATAEFTLTLARIYDKLAFIVGLNRPVMTDSSSSLKN